MNNLAENKITAIAGTYEKGDCIFLLSDLTSIVTPVSSVEKKRRLASGAKSWEMIPYEHIPSESDNTLFLRLLQENKEAIARYVGILCESILAAKGEDIVLVSLARGGTPVGVLCRRYFQRIHQLEVPHYCLSLIRNVGIDENALSYITDSHPSSKIQFLDGWTGMGLISSELNKYVSGFNRRTGSRIDPSLAVLVDSSKICQISGTRSDVILPSCCLNATVCGMISSIYYNPNEVAKMQHHGAIQWTDASMIDYSRLFIEEIEPFFMSATAAPQSVEGNYGLWCRDKIASECNVSDKKRIRLGIGESTRAITRYHLSCLLIRNLSNPHLGFIMEMASAKSINTHEYKQTDYECVAIIAPDEVL